MLAALWLLLAGAGDFPYWVQPCTAELRTEAGCRAGDEELARWALEAWERASDGRLKFTRVEKQEDARLRVLWASARLRLYGEARPFVFKERQLGAELYIRPDLREMGDEIHDRGAADPLFRDTVVYLTCLHESGHGLGLRHTAEFADIMYSFGFGGDIPEYFSRYRRSLATRASIRERSGISEGDRKRLLAMFSQK